MSHATQGGLVISYHCGECAVNWWPYQATDSCPRCGGGTVRRQEPASDDANALFELARIEVESHKKHEAFEAFYAEREANRQDTDEIDSAAVVRALEQQPEQANPGGEGG